MSTLESSLEKIAALAERISNMMPDGSAMQIDSAHAAYRYQKYLMGYLLQPIERISETALDDLLCIDRQKQAIYDNTLQFVKGFPANNVLLWGPRGTGKSSLVKAILNEFHPQGLHMIEVDKSDLHQLHNLISLITDKPQRFILYIDDLSFESGDAAYKTLKTSLDGSLQKTPDNFIVYATSNRRHLMPEYMSDNLPGKMINEEIHHSESVEEKISLSERFGIWLSFHPFSQDDYLQIVWHYLNQWQLTELDSQETREAALRWCLERGSRSGRCAWQFAKSWAGQHQINAE